MENEGCPYIEVCKHYVPDCLNKKYELCWAYRGLEGLIKREVFESKIWKRIMRSEHGHGDHELPKEGWTDSGYVDKD